MEKLTAGDLLRLAIKALEGQGFRSEDAKYIAEEFVIAEIAGVKTHGVGKLVSLNLGNIDAEPMISGHGSIISVNGNGGNGFVLFRKLSKTVAENCRSTGIAAAFVHNFSRYSSLYPYTVSLARQGLVGILTNTAGPAAVAPFGAIDPLTGTNPICFSFPTAGPMPLTIDLATSEVVWGEIRQASLEGRKLISGPFLDVAGKVTTTPAEANSVKAFGGPKGWALNLAIEILAGLLTGGKAGLEVKTEFNCGAVLIAIDPSLTGTANNFPLLVSNLMNEVRSTKPENSKFPVRCPGDRGRNSIIIEDHKKEEIQVPEKTIAMLRRMGDGEKISELANNPLFN